MVLRALALSSFKKFELVMMGSLSNLRIAVLQSSLNQGVLCLRVSFSVELYLLLRLEFQWSALSGPCYLSLV